MNCYRTMLKFSLLITIYNIYKYFSQVLQIAQKPIIDFLYTFIGKNALATKMLESLWWIDLQKLTFWISSFQCRKFCWSSLTRKIFHQHFCVYVVLEYVNWCDPLMFVWKDVVIYNCLKKYFFKTETALMYDAVILFAEALSELDRSQDVQVDQHAIIIISIIKPTPSPAAASSQSSSNSSSISTPPTLSSLSTSTCWS